jgi:hypothetical protein
MRNINAFVESRIYADVLNYYALIELELTDYSLYVTTLPFNVTVGSKLFVSDVGIVDYSPPSQSSVVDKEKFAFSFADPSGFLKKKIQSGEASSFVRVRNGFFNTDNTPNKDTDNMIIAYQGYIDETSFSSDFEESTVNISCASPMADLGLTKTLFTSKDGMDQYNIEDTSFDKVIENNESKFKWGKS